MSELLPCPFCGDACRMCPTPRERYQALCVGCGTLGGQYMDRDAAAEAWNRRSPPSVPPSVTVEEPTIEECCDAAEAAWKTVPDRSQLLTDRDWVRHVVGAVRALCLSRTEKARERTDGPAINPHALADTIVSAMKLADHNTMIHSKGNTTGEDRWHARERAARDAIRRVLAVVGIPEWPGAVSPPARETRPTT